MMILIAGPPVRSLIGQFPKIPANPKSSLFCLGASGLPFRNGGL
jgi:hypothetical protein